MPLMRNKPGYDPTSTMSAKTKRMLGVEEGVRMPLFLLLLARARLRLGKRTWTPSQPVAPAPTPTSHSIPTEELKKELEAVKVEEVKLEKEIARWQRTGSREQSRSREHFTGNWEYHRDRKFRRAKLAKAAKK